VCSENNIPFCFIAHLLEKLTNFNENPDNIAHEMKVYNSKYNLSFDQKYSLLAAMLTGRQKKSVAICTSLFTMCAITTRFSVEDKTYH